MPCKEVKNVDDPKRKKNIIGKIKAETNQPNIKLYTQIVSTPSSSIRNTSVEDSPLLLTPSTQQNTSGYNRKKRSPPSPPDQDYPCKKTNLSTHDDETTLAKSNNLSSGTENNTNKLSPNESELNDPQLIQLRKLLQQDMVEMIKLLREHVSDIEKSNKKLEEKGELITSMKIKNEKLKIDCRKVKLENKKLKECIVAIENKLLENNIIVQGIPDQVWELADNLREKTLVSISHLANGKTPQEKLDIMRKIGIKNV